MYYRAGYFLCIVAMLVFLLAMPLVSQVYAQSAPPVDGGLVVDCGFGESRIEGGREVGKEDCGVEHIFELAEKVVRVLIWLAVTGFVLVLIWFGTVFSLNAFLYAGDAQQAVSRAKSGLKLATLGLILVLGAWLLVRSSFGILGYVGDPFVPPDPIKDSGAPLDAVKLPEVPILTDSILRRGDWSQDGGGVAGAYPSSPPECDTCTYLDGSGVNFKSPVPPPDTDGGCQTLDPKGCYTDAELLRRLQKVKKNTYGWRVTESCPPTVRHQSPCHKDCTCVDVNFVSPAVGDRTDIALFITAAKNHGLWPVYETSNKDFHYSLVTESKLPAENVILLDPEDITAPHFSVYLR